MIDESGRFAEELTALVNRHFQKPGKPDENTVSHGTMRWGFLILAVTIARHYQRPLESLIEELKVVWDNTETHFVEYDSMN